MQWVTLVVFIILIICAYYACLKSFAWTGSPALEPVGLGIKGLKQMYTISGPGFLKKFYQLTQDTLVLKNAGGDAGKPVYPDDMEEYKNNIVDFKQSMLTQIKIFCNEAVPCNNCACPGAEKDPATMDLCKPKPNDDKGGKQASAMRNANAGAAEKFMGIVPKCCCLTKIQTGEWKSVADLNDAEDYTNTDLWTATPVYSTNRPQSQGYTPYNVYTWNDTPTNQSKLTTNPPEPNAILHGCDVSPAAFKQASTTSPDIVTDKDQLTNGNPQKPETKCECKDGDPTLNYYAQMNKSVINVPPPVNKLKANLFAKWGKLDTPVGSGATEKSYRLKVGDPGLSAYTFPDEYYTDSTKTVFKDSSLDTTSKPGVKYILAPIADPASTSTPPKLIGNTSKWTLAELSDSTGILYNTGAKYMVDNNTGKYMYLNPNSTLLTPSVSIPPADFASAVKLQLDVLKTLINAPVIAPFYGGIYNYLFPAK